MGDALSYNIQDLYAILKIYETRTDIRLQELESHTPKTSQGE